MNQNNHDEKLNELKELFIFYDKDKDNHVDLQAFEKMMLCLGIKLENKQKELNSIKQNYFINKNNIDLISFDKFMEYLKKRSNIKEVEEEIIECFKSINKKQNGILSFTEVKQALMDMGEEFDDEEIEEIFNWADPQNKEGITYEEFVRLLCTKY